MVLIQKWFKAIIQSQFLPPQKPRHLLVILFSLFAPKPQPALTSANSNNADIFIEGGEWNWGGSAYRTSQVLNSANISVQLECAFVTLERLGVKPPQTEKDSQP